MPQPHTSIYISALYYSKRRNEEVHIEWRRWGFDRLSWTYRSALFVLQGAAIQQVLGDHYLVLRTTPEKPFLPNFGLRELVLAEIFFSPPELSGFEVFELLMPEAWGLDTQAFS